MTLGKAFGIAMLLYAYCFQAEYATTMRAFRKDTIDGSLHTAATYVMNYRRLKEGKGLLPRNMAIYLASKEHLNEGFRGASLDRTLYDVKAFTEDPAIASPITRKLKYISADI
jgi:hypothetical protein